MKNQLLIFTCFFFLLSSVVAQAPTPTHAGKIRQMLEKLNVFGSVLYVAAHPDDENTRLIAYYANAEHYQTAYLSATRGDGGQNLIGPEIREELGVIRTQELLSARKIDGGKQFFSRAIDFGYSKNPEETFKIWNKEEILSDFVSVFRTFKPDVIITRFNKVPGRNHGHHTASAILAHEAFKLSGDPNAFPEQLNELEVWQPKKIFWNTGWWWFRNNNMDTSQLIKIDVGGYSPLLGKSYTEIAATSRSMHKSQGFGSQGTRGEQIEYLEQWEGDLSTLPFDNINTSWGRIKGSKKAASIIQEAINQFDETNPSNIIDLLLKAKKEIAKWSDIHWKTIKITEIDEVVRAITGIFIELIADQNYYVNNDSIHMSLEAINRSNQPLILTALSLHPWADSLPINKNLAFNQRYNQRVSLQLPKDLPLSNPYWLDNPSGLGLYTVTDPKKIGLPQNKPTLSAHASVKYKEHTIQFSTPISYKYTDPVKGEVYEPVNIGPPVAINILGKVQIFSEDKPKDIQVILVSGQPNVKGYITLQLPKLWDASPKEIEFNFNNKGEEQSFTFSITPPKTASVGTIRATATINGQTFDKGRTDIAYNHIAKQKIFPEAAIRAVRIDLIKKGNKIGYIMGAGDAVSKNLSQIGYRVDLLKKEDIMLQNLKQYDAVILGVRAFNTLPWMSYKNKELFNYVADGGNLIVQYNTNRRLVTNQVAPYDLSISRDRVTVEEANITILNKNHPIITGPNPITEKDFEGWVQERGLYFPNKWSDQFETVLSCNDPNEPPKAGGLLVAKHGKGYYIYTGYSWFRELPAGVPGAYRLFVNMISLGK